MQQSPQKLSNLNFTTEGLKTELLDTVCLMVKDGIKTAFLHKSIQEYFSAHFIKSLTDEEKVKGLYRLIKDKLWPQWEQELTFLQQIDEFRYLSEFHLPTSNEFLELFSYDDTKKIKITKSQFDRVINETSIYIIPIPKDKFNAVGMVTNHKAGNINFKKMFKEINTPELRHFISLGQREVDLLTNPEAPIRYQFINLGTYLKSNPKLRLSLYSGCTQFLERIYKDKIRVEKKLQERNDNLMEALGLLGVTP